jgi:hypothetical protein
MAITNAYFQANPHYITPYTERWLNDRPTKADRNILHRLGGIDVDNNTPTATMLAELGLNWIPVESEMRYGTVFQYNNDNDQRVIYRPDDGAYMGVASAGFVPEGGFAMLVDTFKDFCKQSGAELRSVGNIQKFNKGVLSVEMWMAASIANAQSFNVGSEDKTDAYLIMRCPFKPGQGYKFSIMADRLVCQNGLVAPVKLGNKVYQHGKHFTESKIINVLEGAQSVWGIMQDAHNVLAEVKLDHATAMAQLVEQFGTPGKPLHEQPTVVQSCLQKFERGDFIGADASGLYDTAYALLQCVTEHYNHDYDRFRTQATRTEGMLNTSNSVNAKQLDFLKSISGFAYAQQYGQERAQSQTAQMVRAFA